MKRAQCQTALTLRCVQLLSESLFTDCAIADVNETNADADDEICDAAQRHFGYNPKTWKFDRQLWGGGGGPGVVSLVCVL